jgi:PPOX class probable F420-dependent enzyme
MNLKPFEKQKYLNIETFRKNGQGVKTPVWFAEDGNMLMIWTEADSGKVKRIRRDGKVCVVPSTASGEPIGEWLEAQARVDDSTETVNLAANLFKQKYGVMFNVFATMGKLRKAKHTTIKVSLK